MDTEEYRKRIEEEILKIIRERLEAGQMKADRAKEIARYVLEHLKPHMSYDQIYAVVQKFDDHFPELAKAVIPVVNQYEETVKQIVHQQASKLIQQGKATEATDLMRKAMNKQVKLGR